MVLIPVPTKAHQRLFEALAERSGVVDGTHHQIPGRLLAVALEGQNGIVMKGHRMPPSAGQTSMHGRRLR